MDPFQEQESQIQSPLSGCLSAACSPKQDCGRNILPNSEHSSQHAFSGDTIPDLEHPENETQEAVCAESDTIPKSFVGDTQFDSLVAKTQAVPVQPELPDSPTLERLSHRSSVGIAKVTSLSTDLATISRPNDAGLSVPYAGFTFGQGPPRGFSNRCPPNPSKAIQAVEQPKQDAVPKTSQVMAPSDNTRIPDETRRAFSAKVHNHSQNHQEYRQGKEIISAIKEPNLVYQNQDSVAQQSLPIPMDLPAIKTPRSRPSSKIRKNLKQPFPEVSGTLSRTHPYSRQEVLKVSNLPQPFQKPLPPLPRNQPPFQDVIPPAAVLKTAVEVGKPAEFSSPEDNGPIHIAPALPSNLYNSEEHSSFAEYSAANNKICEKNATAGNELISYGNKEMALQRSKFTHEPGHSRNASQQRVTSSRPSSRHQSRPVSRRGANSNVVNRPVLAGELVAQGISEAEIIHSNGATKIQKSITQQPHGVKVVPVSIHVNEDEAQVELKWREDIAPLEQKLADYYAKLRLLKLQKAEIERLHGNDVQSQNRIQALEAEKEALSKKLEKYGELKVKYIAHMNDVVICQKSLNQGLKKLRDNYGEVVQQWEDRTKKPLEKISNIITEARDLKKISADLERKAKEFDSVEAQLKTKTEEVQYARELIEKLTKTKDIAVADFERKLMEFQRERDLNKQLNVQINTQSKNHNELLAFLTKLNPVLELTTDNGTIAKILELEESTITKIGELSKTIQKTNTIGPDLTSLSNIIKDSFTKIEKQLSAAASNDTAHHESDIKTLADLRERISRIQSELETQRKRSEIISQLRQKNEILILEASKREVELKTKESELNGLRQDLSNVQGQLAEKTEKLTTILNRPRDDPILQTRVEELANANRYLQSLVEAADKKASLAGEESCLHQESSAEIQRRVQEVEEKLRKSERMVEKFNEEKNKYVASCRMIAEKIRQDATTASNNQKIEMAAQHDEAVRVLEQRRTESESQLRLLRKEHQRVRDENAKYARDAEKLLTDLGLLKDQSMQQAKLIQQLESLHLTERNVEFKVQEVQALRKELAEIRRVSTENSINLEKALDEIRANVLGTTLSEKRIGEETDTNTRRDWVQSKSVDHAVASPSIWSDRDSRSAVSSTSAPNSRHRRERAALSAAKTQSEMPTSTLAPVVRQSSRKIADRKGSNMTHPAMFEDQGKGITRTKTYTVRNSRTANSDEATITRPLSTTQPKVRSDTGSLTDLEKEGVNKEYNEVRGATFSTAVGGKEGNSEASNPKESLAQNQTSGRNVASASYNFSNEDSSAVQSIKVQVQKPSLSVAEESIRRRVSRTLKSVLKTTDSVSTTSNTIASARPFNLSTPTPASIQAGRANSHATKNHTGILGSTAHRSSYNRIASGHGTSSSRAAERQSHNESYDVTGDLSPIMHAPQRNALKRSRSISFDETQEAQQAKAPRLSLAPKTTRTSIPNS